METSIDSRPDSAAGVSSTTAQATPPKDQETRTVHPCEGLTQEGRPCGRYVGSVWHDGAWKCHLHRPGRAKAGEPAAPPPTRRPVKGPPTTPAEAVALAGWAADNVARGALTHQRSNAVVTACREYRMSWEAAADYDAVERRLDAALGLAVAWIRTISPSNKVGDPDARRAFADAWNAAQGPTAALLGKAPAKPATPDPIAKALAAAAATSDPLVKALAAAAAEPDPDDAPLDAFEP